MLYSKKELPRHSENFRDRQFFFVLQNHMSWANFLTFTAACTLIVIDVRTEIGNCDRLGRTVLLTFFTADTAKLAGSCNCLTFMRGSCRLHVSVCHMVPARSGDVDIWQHICHRLYMLPDLRPQYHSLHGSHQMDMPLHSFRSPYIHNVQFFAPLPGMKAIISQSSTPVYSYFTVVLSQVPAHFTKAT